MEVSALKHSGTATVPHGGSALLRLQSDERLIAMIRRGNQSAFEALVSRYNSRLFAFCRHMLGSKEDAEDVLQEVFASSYNALLGDDRPINARPWLYRIARNRCLNHLRRAQAIGVDSMDIHIAEGGVTTADKVHKREEFRQLMADVQELPETQKTALLLREIDALSYDQISEVMETTVPSVKSLLVRARVSLAEAAEARLLSCEEVRIELGEVAEGLKRISPPVRRHVKGCERCKTFKSQLKATNKSLAAFLPIGPLVILKKFILGHVGITAASSGAGAAGSAAAGSAAGGAFSAGLSAIATKAAAGITAAALVTVGTVEVKQASADRPAKSDAPAVVAAASPPAAAAIPVVQAATPQPKVSAPTPDSEKLLATTNTSETPTKDEKTKSTKAATTTPVAEPTTPVATTTPVEPKSQEVSETISLPDEQAPPQVVTPTQPTDSVPTAQPTVPTTPTESTPSVPTSTGTPTEAPGTVPGPSTP